MRLYQQLILFMLAATVLPLAVVGFLLLSRAEKELASHIDSEQRALAEATAEAVSAQLMETVDALARSAELLEWEQLSDEEVRGALNLLYGQSSSVSAVLQLDAEGRPLGAAVFQEEEAGGHPGFDPTTVPGLARAVPVQRLRQGGKGQAALGRVYAHVPTGRAAVAVAVKLGEGEGAPYALAEVVFTDLENLLARRAEGHPGRIDLVETGGRVLASSLKDRRLQPLEPALLERLAAGGEPVRSLRVEAASLRVSTARVAGELGFDVVVAVDEAVAMAPVRAMRRTVLLSIGGALAVLLGVGALFTRRLNRRLAEVVAGAEAFSRGELERRVRVEGGDELSELASTFNRMGAELESARARMLRWNDDLKARVEEATAELRTAQAQLLEAQKLAAVGQLGAGVAHEINNPLAGILGNTQLLLLDRTEGDADFDALRKIEQSAKRCKEITQNLLRFSQQRDKPALRRVELNAVVRDALSLTENQIKGESITLSPQLDTSTPTQVKADPGHLSQVVLALLSNARTAMMKTDTKQLSLRTGERDGRAFIEVEDTGKGIAPEHLPRIFEPFFTTKDVWSNVGLGLSVAWRVITEAGGTIEVRTEVGKGSCFTVWLPKA
jgi:signal transduction histidine kinase